MCGLRNPEPTFRTFVIDSLTNLKLIFPHESIKDLIFDFDKTSLTVTYHVKNFLANSLIKQVFEKSRYQKHIL